MLFIDNSLATALCRNTAVQRAFPDGIAWITIGREWDGNAGAQMREVGRALGEDVERGWDTKVACENRYRTILRQKAALIVVDDVWNAEHLMSIPFFNATHRTELFATETCTASDGNNGVVSEDSSPPLLRPENPNAEMVLATCPTRDDFRPIGDSRHRFE
jgi:hypothetical protein